MGEPPAGEPPAGEPPAGEPPVIPLQRPLRQFSAGRWRIRPEIRVFDPAEFRGGLTRRLVWLLVLVILLGCAGMVTTHWTHLTADDVVLFFGPIFTAVVTLTTSAVGFWFGQERERARERDREENL